MGAASTTAERSSTFGAPPRTAIAGPPAGPAIDHPPTRAALGTHARLPGAFVGFAISIVVVGGVLLALGDAPGVGLRVVAAGGGFLIAATFLLRRWLWMRRVLRTQPWIARRGHYHVTGWGRYAHALLLVEADAHGPEAVCTVPELRWRLAALAAPGGEVELWVAGDPTRRAVATVRGEEIVPIAQPRWGPWRRHLRRRLERRGVR